MELYIQKGGFMNVTMTIRTLPNLVSAVRNIRKGKPIAMSFDIADYCTLRCPYCYWLESTQHKQLPVDEIVSITSMAVANGIIHATWVGGEPALRPDVLEAVTPMVPLNWIVTNGMAVKPMVKGYDQFDLARDLPNTWVIVSLDGVGESHDQSRKHRGLYDEIRSRFYRTHRSRCTMTTTTLHQGNRHQPAQLLAEWRTSGILGMTFEFATPIGRPANREWDLVGEDRDQVINELISLKRQNGSFMKNSVFGLGMQRSANLSSWTGPTRCPTAKLSVSYDSLGRKKAPCILGSNDANPLGKRPNCGSCGCHVPTIFEGLKRLDWQTLQSAFWFLG